MTSRGIFAIKISPKSTNNAIAENTRGMLREKNKREARAAELVDDDTLQMMERVVEDGMSRTVMKAVGITDQNAG